MTTDSTRTKKSSTYVFLTLVGASMLFPFVWMILTALKSPENVSVIPPQWIPKPCLFSNFVEAWKAVPFGRGYINSTLVVVTVTLGQVFTSSLAAFAFARLRFPGRERLFFCYLATMMIPGAVTMIPVFVLLAKMPAVLDAVFSSQAGFFSRSLYFWGDTYMGKLVGVDSYFALMAPGMFSAYGTFLLRQFFMSIPADYEDAAKIDGCGLFGIYWRIILPMSKPALTTLAIFTFMGAWKNFMWPLVVTHSQELEVLPVMLTSFQGQYQTDWTLLMAGSLITLLPMLVMFVVGQKYFMKGIKIGGIKG